MKNALGIRRGLVLLGAGCLALACNNESNPARASDAGTDTGIGSASASESESDSGSASATESDSSDSSMDSDSQGSNSAGGVPKFDVGSPDGSIDCSQGGGGGGGGTDFSYIWIANSNQGTVSKVNTQTLVEEGRYYTRPDGAGNPSRTSVNLNGDVAVANRAGGLVAIAARPEDCPDPSNTSTGPNDIKPWPDGCVLWYTDFTADSQRPVAWTQGQYNTDICRYEGMHVWTSTHDSGTTVAEVYKIRGADGSIEDQVTIDNMQTHVYGIYGMAVDTDGNVWGSELGLGQLINVNLTSMMARTWQVPQDSYGMTVDSNGKIWTCRGGVSRFDPITETWDTLASLSSPGNGCMDDGQGTLWVAAEGFVGVDISSTPIQEVSFLTLPARVRGVSFDFEGYIWGPSINSNEAYRVDPGTAAVDTVTGFDYPYTYSDMTGFALSNVGSPQG
jgi:streptogramin lyase